ncbi:hypothetical protein M6B38_345705 [Iris pallida]|uniref:Uncharacterized protein n=1 Tax=Iris pallida TaxID=29817 RepID=A0AAX6GTK2_IRIPA|nr:hypothetical protein M6B38_345705 [Iris pallida]
MTLLLAVEKFWINPTRRSSSSHFRKLCLQINSVSGLPGEMEAICDTYYGHESGGTFELAGVAMDLENEEA